MVEEPRSGSSSRTDSRESLKGEQPIYPDVPTALGYTQTVETAGEMDELIQSADGNDVVALLEDRAANRHEPRLDAVIEVEDWATRDKYDIAQSKLIVAGEVTNYSDDAVHARGTFYVDTDTVGTYDYLHNVLAEHENDEYDNGSAFFPKSAIKMIVLYKPSELSDSRGESVQCNPSETEEL